MLTTIYAVFSVGGFLNSRKALAGSLLFPGALYTRGSPLLQHHLGQRPWGALGELPGEPGGHALDRPSLVTTPGLPEQVAQSRAQEGILVQCPWMSLTGLPNIFSPY